MRIWWQRRRHTADTIGAAIGLSLAGNWLLAAGLISWDPQGCLWLLVLCPAVVTALCFGVTWFEQRGWPLTIAALLTTLGGLVGTLPWVGYAVWAILLPLMLGGAVIGTVAGGIISGNLYEIRVATRGTCPSCGYDLRGLPRRICPECGRPFESWEVGMEPGPARDMDSE